MTIVDRLSSGRSLSENVIFGAPRDRVVVSVLVSQSRDGLETYQEFGKKTCAA